MRPLLYLLLCMCSTVQGENKKRQVLYYYYYYYYYYHHYYYYCLLVLMVTLYFKVSLLQCNYTFKY